MLASFWQESLEHYRRVKASLAGLAKKTAPIDFAHGYNLASLLAEKIELKLELERAYASRDKTALEALVRRIPGTIKLIDNLLASFRRQWYRRNKPQGFEPIQIRLAGSKQRYAELRQRLSELLAGKVQLIPELEELPDSHGGGWNWRHFASASSII